MRTKLFKNHTTIEDYINQTLRKIIAFLKGVCATVLHERSQVHM